MFFASACFHFVFFLQSILHFTFGPPLYMYIPSSTLHSVLRTFLNRVASSGRLASHSGRYRRMMEYSRKITGQMFVRKSALVRHKHACCGGRRRRGYVMGERKMYSLPGRALYRASGPCLALAGSQLVGRARIPAGWRIFCSAPLHTP